MITLLSAVTAFVCLRSRSKTSAPSDVQEEQDIEVEMQSPGDNNGSSVEQLTQVMGKNQEPQEGATSESGSNGKNSE